MTQSKKRDAEQVQGTNGTVEEETVESGNAVDTRIEDGMLRIKFATGEEIEVSAKRFRKKTADIQRDLAAEFCYDEMLEDDPERDNYDPQRVIDMLISEVKNGNVESPYVVSWTALVANDDAKGKDAKKFQRNKFVANWNKLLPVERKQSVSKSALKERIAELEAELEAAQKLIAELQNA